MAWIWGILFLFGFILLFIGFRDFLSIGEAVKESIRTGNDRKLDLILARLAFWWAILLIAYLYFVGEKLEKYL